MSDEPSRDSLFLEPDHELANTCLNCGCLISPVALDVHVRFHVKVYRLEKLLRQNEVTHEAGDVRPGLGGIGLTRTPGDDPANGETDPVAEPSGSA